MEHRMTQSVPFIDFDQTSDSRKWSTCRTRCYIDYGTMKRNEHISKTTEETQKFKDGLKSASSQLFTAGK